MNIWKLKALARLYRAPAGEGGDGSGEKVDRGDDFVPTDDDAADAAAAAEAALAAKSAKVAKAAKQVAAVAKAGLKGLDADADADADEEAPDGETEEEKAEREAAAAKKGAKRIPLSRHEAILAKERERREVLETQLKGYQGQQAVVKTNDEISKRETKIVELEGEMAKAQADGEHAKVAKLMRDIRTLDREVMALESEVKIAAAESRAIEVARYRVTLERIEEQYPILNEDSDEFDEDVYKEVVDLMNAYKAAGRAPSDALQRAVKKELGASTYAQKQATTVKPRVDEADVDVQAKTKAERTAAATDKTLKALKQPSTAVAKTGINSNDAGAARTAKDVIKMSQSDFAKLDEKELAKLRGDEVEAE